MALIENIMFRPVILVSNVSQTDVLDLHPFSAENHTVNSKPIKRAGQTEYIIWSAAVAFI